MNEVRRRRVFLVEDDPETVRFLAEACARLGAEMVHADSSVRARELFANGEWDLVLSDGHLRDGLRGPEFVSWVRLVKGYSGLCVGISSVRSTNEALVMAGCNKAVLKGESGQFLLEWLEDFKP